MSWGPTNWSLSGVPMSVMCQRSVGEPVVKAVHGQRYDTKKEKNYTYRQASEWAFLDSRPGRRVYSAIPRKSQWSPNKDTPNYAAARKRREHEQAQKRESGCRAERSGVSQREKRMLPETYPETSQRSTALGIHRFSSLAKRGGERDWTRVCEQNQGLTYDGVAVDLADVQILLDLLDMFRLDPVGHAPDLVRGRVWIWECFPERPLDERHDAARCFGSSAVVLAVDSVSWCCPSGYWHTNIGPALLLRCKRSRILQPPPPTTFDDESPSRPHDEKPHKEK